MELHDRPIPAAEIMLRNPQCYVAHPHVFREPWAIVRPDTTLMLGHKFYVVPIKTIRKLQLLSSKQSPPTSHVSCSHEDNDAKVSNCWLMFPSKKDDKTNNNNPKKSEKKCFLCLMGVKIKESSEEGRVTEPDRTRRMKSSRRGIEGSPRRRSSFDYWQPSLESIIEE